MDIRREKTEYLAAGCAFSAWERAERIVSLFAGERGGSRERAGHFTRSVVSLEYVGMGQLPLGDVRAEQSLQLFVARQKRKYISHCRPCLSANPAFVRMELLYQIIAAMSNGNTFLRDKYGFFFYLRIKREENMKIAPQCDIFIVRRGIKYKRKQKERI